MQPRFCGKGSEMPFPTAAAAGVDSDPVVAEKAARKLGALIVANLDSDS